MIKSRNVLIYMEWWPTTTPQSQRIQISKKPPENFSVEATYIQAHQGIKLHWTSIFELFKGLCTLMSTWKVISLIRALCLALSAKSWKQVHQANHGELNLGDRRTSLSLLWTHLAIYVDYRDRLVKSPRATLTLYLDKCANCDSCCIMLLHFNLPSSQPRVCEV